jgi:endonuclease/exonuclease/phosphatase family metal-dependent hydrolase
VKASNIDRFLSWAVFKQKSTGRLFLFGTTHLENGAKFKALRVRQVETIIDTLKRVSDGKLPTIMTGDFNTHKWISGGNKPYDAMVAAGYKDPLGNTYKSRHTAPGAFVEKRIRTEYSSTNGMERKARKLPYINGTYLDYILVTPMRVSEWETVVKVDSRGRFIGTIPSDHNMVRATVWLP